MVARDQAFKRILSIIGTKGQTRSVIDKALTTYDALVKRGWDLRKSSVPEIDTTEADGRRKAREARENNSGYGRDKQCANGANKKREHNNSKGGTVDQKSQVETILKDVEALTKNGCSKEQAIISAVRLSLLSEDQPTPEAVQKRPGAMYASGNIDLSTLTGHQRAALSLGVDIEKVAPEALEKLDGPQMQALAQRQHAGQMQELRNKQAEEYREKYGNDWGPRKLW